MILHWCVRSASSAWPAIPGTEVEICSLRGVLNCHGGDEKWLIVIGVQVQVAKE